MPDKIDDTITEFTLRRAIAIMFVCNVFAGAVVALSELAATTFVLGYQRAALNLAIGIAVGVAIAGGLTRLLQSRITSSFVIPIKSWHLNVGFGLLCLLWAGIHALLS